MLTTLFSVLLILIGTGADYSSCSTFAEANEFRVSSVIFSLGTFMFGFGGHAVFPTIQHDMKKPQRFTRSAVVAFGGEFECCLVFSLVCHSVLEACDERRSLKNLYLFLRPDFYCTG